MKMQMKKYVSATNGLEEKCLYGHHGMKPEVRRNGSMAYLIGADESLAFLTINIAAIRGATAGGAPLTSIA